MDLFNEKKLFKEEVKMVTYDGNKKSKFKIIFFSKEKICLKSDGMCINYEKNASYYSLNYRLENYTKSSF